MNTQAAISEIDLDIPTLDEIAAARRLLDPYIVETPVHRWRGSRLAEIVGDKSDIVLKLELLQHTGSFKARPALLNLLRLPPDAMKRGVTAVSAGNHAIAISYAAQRLGTSAKVVMMKTANPFRVALCKRLGAEVILAEDVHAAFAFVKEIEAKEGRAFIHPFEGRTTVLGDSTLGFEWAHQVPDMDAVIIPIGGGGLAAGASLAIKLLQPKCRVFGVEPEGADTMHRSFAAGRPEKADKVTTIADSLAPPYALPYSYGVCRRYIDELVMIDDAAMKRAMSLLFAEAKLAVEPAGGAATAALTGPLRDRLKGQRVGVLVCGSNIDGASFARYLAEGGNGME
ncbi:MAG TPA: threonine/serine dehydratase [Verrucomicrobiae bacterium]|nr:threonine/serine dehydratase [Verrucomicrobiae bacterium]